MKMQLASLVVISALAFGLGACEDSVLSKPPGKYEKTTNTTDASGTTIGQQTSTEVTVDDHGNKKAVVKSKTTRDPKGLFNKSTTSETEQVIEEKR